MHDVAGVDQPEAGATRCGDGHVRQLNSGLDRRLVGLIAR
jgi:hypothetical protein